MNYFLRSICTISFWRYALFSKGAIVKLFATIGALYAFLEMMDFFGIYTKDRYSRYAIIPIVLVSAAWVIVSRRPVTKISYKIPRKDFAFEVKITDLFNESGDLVISSNTTFDTDISNGLISTESLQGQFSLKFFQGNTDEIDVQLHASLRDARYEDRPSAPGKTKEFPIGTVAKVRLPGRNFYFVAMSRLNDQGTASTTLRNVEDSLTSLWQFVTERGELRDLVIPLMGTGRGRLEISRKKMVEKIAQSFADASKDKIFSNRLIIVIRPEDADRFGVNLFEIKDYLTQSLNI